MDSDQDRLDIPEAATRLGLSVDAIRKRIQRGSLHAEKLDGRWFVVLPVQGGPRHGLDIDQDTSRTGPDANGTAGPAVRDATGQAIAALAEAFTKALDAERERSSVAEQAAAMWQERARNLEAELQHVLALPAHEEEPERPRRWWLWWRKVN